MNGHESSLSNESAAAQSEIQNANPDGSGANRETDSTDIPIAAMASTSVPSSQALTLETDVPLPKNYQNLAAQGGSVAAVTLGLLSIFGVALTSWSIFNAVIGLALGAWGLSSPAKKTAWLGITTCLVGGVLGYYLWV